MLMACRHRPQGPRICRCPAAPELRDRAEKRLRGCRPTADLPLLKCRRIAQRRAGLRANPVVVAARLSEHRAQSHAQEAARAWRHRRAFLRAKRGPSPDARHTMIAETTAGILQRLLQIFLEQMVSKFFYLRACGPHRS